MSMRNLALKKPRVTLVQRTIPHYRVPLFRALAADHRFDWTFNCGDHDGRNSPGLPARLEGLKVNRITNYPVGSSLCWQRGISTDPRDFDVVVAEYGWTILSNPLLFARAKAKGLATIGWSKGVSQNPGQAKSKIRRKFEQASISLCDAVLAYGEISKEYFLDLGVPSERIFVAQNAIDTIAISDRQIEARKSGAQLRSDLGIRDSPVVGFLGRIGAAKKVDCLIGAFEYAASRGTAGSLLIAGQGPCSDEVDALIKESPFNERIFRVNDVPAGFEDAIFQAMDIYLSFSQPGLGILEAMAHGISIVATPERYPETELLIDDQTAFLSEEQTVESLGAKLLTALNHSQRRQQVAQRAQECVLEKATIENMREQICRAVTFVLDARRSSPLSFT